MGNAATLGPELGIPLGCLLRDDPFPQRVDLGSQLGFGARPVEHDVGRGPPSLVVRLGGYTAPCLCLAHPSALDEALQPQLGRRVDDDKDMERVRGTDLDEQGDVVHDDGTGVGRSCLGVTLGGQSPYLGVDDRVEALPRAVVGEDDPRERRAVELAISTKDGVPELADDGVQAYRPGSDGLTSQQVMVDDDSAELGEAAKDD